MLVNVLPKDRTDTWAIEQARTCPECLKNFSFCKDHEPRRESKTARTWTGMYHQEKCPFYIRLCAKEMEAVDEYVSILRVDIQRSDFKPNELVCPHCDGWDITYY